MSLRAVAPGPLATVQDVGRFGHRGFGVPVSGPFDRRSAAVANALLGNDPGLAVLELTGFGGVFEAESELALAMAGAPMPARIDGDDRERIGAFTITMKAGTRLVLGRAASGFRAYLAVRGGWQVDSVLGSRSREVPIRAGEVLPAESSRTATLRVDFSAVGSTGPIRYLDGPDASLMEAGALERSAYRVGGDSDRMGLRLEGERLAIEAAADRLSSPVAPGAIQVAGGRPIVLGPACGTMGGYPHAGQVLACDLDRLGQMRPGAAVRFRRVEREEARRLDRAYRDGLAGLIGRLRVAVGRA